MIELLSWKCIHSAAAAAGVVMLIDNEEEENTRQIVDIKYVKSQTKN